MARYSHRLSCMPLRCLNSRQSTKLKSKQTRFLSSMLDAVLDIRHSCTQILPRRSSSNPSKCSVQILMNFSLSIAWCREPNTRSNFATRSSWSTTSFLEMSFKMEKYGATSLTSSPLALKSVWISFERNSSTFTRVPSLSYRSQGKILTVSKTLRWFNIKEMINLMWLRISCERALQHESMSRRWQMQA